MNGILEEGVLGIVTGIITTAVLFTLKVFWSSTVTPFFKKVRYQGVKIDGYWIGQASATENDGTAETIQPFQSEYSLFLEQNAHDLTGSFHFKFKNKIKQFALEFNVTGYMWEGYVTLNFTPKDKRLTSYATGLLKLHDGGISLRGTWLFRDVEREFVSQTPLELFRSTDLQSI